MLFKEIIRRKRDRGALTAEEIDTFVSGLADNSLPAEQVSALAMAIFLNSMSAEETGALTLSMAKSGTVIDWQADELGGPVADKHSTGGVGDKVSFLLAPIAAACGCYTPMISGRGLGHTGGTLDKLDAIPGYRSTPDLATLKRVVQAVGCAIVGQTDDIAPADRRLYAIRDVTGTVESVPLITASILSKKVAAGNEVLIMDVKVGSGAFMETMDEARALARSIIGAAEAIGLKTRALLTDMNEVLGENAGNVVEIKESIDYLTNTRREMRLDEVVQSLTAEMLVAAGLAPTREEARARVEDAVASGRAAEKFAAMVAALGGPADIIERADRYLTAAPIKQPIYPKQEGYLKRVDGRALGNAIIALGGGRRMAGDALDLAVGFTQTAKIGAIVGPEQPLAFVHAASEDAARSAAEAYKAACAVSDAAPQQRPLVYETLSAENFAFD